MAAWAVPQQEAVDMGFAGAQVVVVEAAVAGVGAGEVEVVASMLPLPPASSHSVGRSWLTLVVRHTNRISCKLFSHPAGEINIRQRHICRIGQADSALNALFCSAGFPCVGV